MLLLAVDTSTKIGSLAVLRDGRLLGVRATSSAVPHASGLFSDLQGLLEELCIELKSFDLYAVAAGPGSFTGLRIGLTAAKAWAEAFARPIVAVDSLEAIALQAVHLPQVSADAPIAAVQDARRGQIFGALFGRVAGSPELLKPVTDDLLLPASEFVSLVPTWDLPRIPVFVSPASEPLQSALDNSPFAGTKVEVVSAVLASFIGQIGYARALRGEFVDALHLDANYVRRTDAEVKWQDRSPA